MSTRSAIICHTSSDYSGIYCHSDGYPSWMGTVLLTAFNSKDKAQELVQLGDISTVRHDGSVCAYHRDHGEELNITRDINPARVAAAIDHDGHIYIFENGEWRYIDLTSGEKHWNNDIPLREIIQRPDIQIDIASMASSYPAMKPYIAS